MYFGDKEALEDLKNNSICVLVDEGIKNISCESDLITKNIVYVNNIILLPNGQESESQIVVKGSMVRYKPVVVLFR